MTRSTAPPKASFPNHTTRSADKYVRHIRSLTRTARARVSEPASVDAAALRARADAARRDAQRWAAVAEALWDAAPMDD